MVPPVRQVGGLRRHDVQEESRLYVVRCARLLEVGQRVGAGVEIDVEDRASASRTESPVPRSSKLSATIAASKATRRRSAEFLSTSKIAPSASSATGTSPPTLAAGQSHSHSSQTARRRRPTRRMRRPEHLQASAAAALPRPQIAKLGCVNVEITGVQLLYTTPSSGCCRRYSSVSESSQYDEA